MTKPLNKLTIFKMNIFIVKLNMNKTIVNDSKVTLVRIQVDHLLT